MKNVMEQAEAVMDLGKGEHSLGRCYTASMAFVADAANEGKLVFTRLTRQARHVAGDLVEDARHGIKRNPLRAVGLAFGAGTLIALVVGYRPKR